MDTVPHDRPRDPAGEPVITHAHVDVGELRLHCAFAGPETGPLVVLLHGFPDFWWTWRQQIPVLAAAGFRVVAPDLRGYNLSDKPYDVASYSVGHLVRDVAGLIRALGRERAHVVGHDWGAGIAWEFAMRRPEMIDRLAVLNGPHPKELAKSFLHKEQLKKSWYVFFFALPGVPEKMHAKNDFELLRKLFRDWPKADVDKYVEAAKRSRNLNGPINYYRAMLRGFARGHFPAYRPIPAPTLVVWGEDDPHLGKELARPDSRWIPNLRVAFVSKAGHWVHLDAAPEVNALLLEHLRP